MTTEEEFAVLEPLDRRSPVPLYSQIQEQLRRYILQRQRESSGEGPVRFYTDDELAGIFKVSRMTVRQAVQELVNEGLLYRVKGLGTFISPPQVQGQLKEIERFVDEWSVQGKDIQVEVLAHKIVPCPVEWA
ncbi:MAG: GntR family transcriptional regulator, partial [Firmicutes bacterium]|nr:GntR family transcriptional regulator [Bacillota bacterium]